MIRYLVIRADGAVRVTTRFPNRMALDEIAYRLVITIPERWGHLLGDIRIDLPEPPEVPEVQEA